MDRSRFAASMNHANIILKPRIKAMEPVADRLAVPKQNCDCFSIDNPPFCQAANLSMGSESHRRYLYRLADRKACPPPSPDHAVLPLTPLCDNVTRARQPPQAHVFCAFFLDQVRNQTRKCCVVPPSDAGAAIGCRYSVHKLSPAFQHNPRSQSATLPPCGPCTAATKASAPKQRLSAVWGPGPSPDSEAGPAGFQEKVPCCFDFSKSAQGRPQGVSPIQLLLRGDFGVQNQRRFGGRFRTRAPIHALAPRHRKFLPGLIPASAGGPLLAGGPARHKYRRLGSVLCWARSAPLGPESGGVGGVITPQSQWRS